MKCFICPSTKFVDDHHIDCKEGKVSPETVPLCRRCHRTYHDLGLEWFDDDLLPKAIELENKRRQLFGQAPVRREEIKRSNYYYSKHGIPRPALPRLIIENLPPPQKGEPMDEKLAKWVKWATV